MTKNEKEAVGHLKNILKDTERLLKPLDDEATKGVKEFQRIQVKNYNAINTVLNMLNEKEKIIDIFLNYLEYEDIDEAVCKYMNCADEDKEINCKDCIRKFFINN